MAKLFDLLRLYVISSFLTHTSTFWVAVVPIFASITVLAIELCMANTLASVGIAKIV